MDSNVGSIQYDARINTSDFDKDANYVEKRGGDVASNIEKSGNRGFSDFANSASTSFGSIATGLESIARKALLVGTAGAFGIGAAVKASWDQVGAVQQATVALGAYEKNTGAVNTVLSQLVAYARSDMGVLFNRKDLFESAQNLKLMGDNTGDLVGHVQILSRSVGLGLSNWDELNQIVGRVGSTGRLTGDDFDNLTKAGFKLNPALRNTNISFSQLFDNLNKGIPVDALAGQANTIQGMGIRLQTAFRNIGDAILGVNSDTGKFVQGGLGDKLVGLMGTLTTLLKTPALKQGFATLGASIGNFAAKALPLVIDGFTWLVNHQNTVVAGIGALVTAFVAAKVAAIGFGIASAIVEAPMLLVAYAIIAVIAALTFLQIRFDIFGKAASMIMNAWGAVSGFFVDLWNRIVSLYGDIAKWFTDRFNTVRDAIVGAFDATVGAIKNSFDAVIGVVKAVFDAITGFIEDHKKVIIDWSIVIGTILLPKIVAIGTEFALSAAKSSASIAVMSAKSVASFAVMSASAVVNAALAATAWTVSAATTAAEWVSVTLPKLAIGFATMAAEATIAAAEASAAFIAGSVRTLIAWTISFAGYLVGVGLAVASTAAAAISMAASWLLALGPIGLIIAVVIGVAALIIANWETVKGWFLAFWNLLGQAASMEWDYIKSVFSAVIGFFTSVFSGAYNAVRGAFSGIGSFFVGVWDTIKNIFTSIGSTIGSAIGGAFKTVVNSIIGFAENTINGFIRAINGAIGIINKIPKVNISTISEFNIPKLAKGGIVPATPGGILANLGEGGQAEAVIPLDQLDKIGNGGGNSSQNVTVNIDMAGIMTRSKSDERDIAKSLIKRINEELSAKSMPLIGGGALA